MALGFRKIQLKLQWTEEQIMDKFHEVRDSIKSSYSDFVNDGGIKMKTERNYRSVSG